MINVRKWIKHGMVMAAAVMLAMPVASARADNCGVPATSGLVGYWKLDETSGTTAADSSGNGNTGTMNNGMNGTDDSGPGMIGGALNFIDASNHSIGVGSAAGLDDIFSGGGTMAMWIKPRVDAESVVAIKTTNVTTIPDGYQFALSSSARRPQLKVSFSGGRIEFRTSSGYGIPKNEWSHVAVVYDSNSVTNDPTFYINGQAVPSGKGIIGTPVDPYTSDAALSLYLGGYNAEQYMDDFRVYSRVLSDEEIGQLYQYGRGQRGSMVFNDSRDAIEYCNGTDWVMAGLGSYTPNAVTFNGTSDYLVQSGASYPSSKTVSGSFWVRKNSTATTFRLYEEGSSWFVIFLDADGSVDFVGKNAGGSYALLCDLGPSGLNDTAWHHVMFSFDLNDTNKRNIYVDDANVTPGSCGAYVDDFLTHQSTVYFGRDAGGATYFDGEIGDFWMDFGTYIDFSQAENRSKFVADSGMPMYLGQDGSLPTGHAPDIFLSGDTANWHTNKGTGGGFTENGAITYSSSTPANCIPGAGPFVQESVYNTSMNSSRVWGDGQYIYVGDDTNKMMAFSFDGTSLSLLDTFDTGGGVHAVWGDGTYIYAGDDWGTIRALTFDGSTFTQVGSSFSVPGSPEGIWGDGQYIYVADWGSGIEAYTFDGSSFTQVATYDPGSVYAVWGDGTYIYAADDQGGGLYAFSFDGTAFTLLDTAATGWVYSVTGDGTYIYVGTNPNLEAFTFDGSTFSQVGSIGGAQQYLYTWTDGSYVYAMDVANNTINAFSFDGSTFNLVDSDASLTAAGRAIWGDGTYIYGTALTSGLHVFSGFAGCNCGVNPRGDIVHKGIMEYNDDFTVMQYCNGNDWVAMGPVGGTPPTDGLVGYWKLDETSGATLADSSGNGNNGTWTDNENNDLAEEATIGLVDGGLNFEPDATTEGNDHVLIGTPAVLNNLGPMTVCSWAKTLNGTFGANSPMVAKSTGGQTGWQLYFNRAGGDRVGFRTTEQAYKNGSTKMIRNTWTHACATWDGTDTAAGITIYLNGQDAGEFSSADLGATLDDSTYDLYIGRNLGGSTKWEGGLDEVRIYNRVLSPQEIAQLYQFGMSGGLGDVKNGCVSPAGVEGVIFYNSDFSVMQYCNGEEWIGIGQ